MKKNRLAIILVIVLGSLSAWFIMHNKTSTIGPEMKDFAVADTGSITKIHLKDKANKEVTLEKMEDLRWRLNGKYYARPDAVLVLLRTIKSIKARNPVGKRAMENVIKELATGSTKIEIYSGDKIIKEYYVGGQTQDDEGTYMLMQDPETGLNSSMPFVVYIPGFNGYVSGRYFTDELEWRDRTVFSYPWGKIKSIQVGYALQKDSSFIINVKGENDFEVLDASGRRLDHIDTGKVKQYIGYYFNIQHEGIEKVKPNVKDSIFALGWVHSIKVTDQDGKVNTIQTWHKPPPQPGMTDNNGKPLKEDTDRMYATMNGNKDELVVIQYFVFGKLFMPSSHFIMKMGKKK